MPVLLPTALLLSLGAAVGLGFGRFAYSLLLVPMRADLGWSYAQAGLLNTANGLGYLAGALLVGPLVARWGAVPVFRSSIVLTGLSLIAAGLLPSYWLLLLTRAVAGFGGGVAFVGGAAVVLQLDSSPASAFPLGVYYSGPGIGIALSGLLVPLLLGPAALSWQGAWIGLGLLSLLLLLLVERVLRQVPARPRLARSEAERLFVAADYLRIWPTLTAYTLFGLGYIGYMTFVVAFLRDMQVSPRVVEAFWVFLGCCAASSGFVWGPVVRRLAPRRSMGLILTALALGALLPVVSLAPWSFALSAALFGGSFLAVISAVTRDVRQTLPAARWTTVMGNATALFGSGQLLGPLLTGLVADMRGGLLIGLVASAATLALSGIIVLLGPSARRLGDD